MTTNEERLRRLEDAVVGGVAVMVLFGILLVSLILLTVHV